MKVPRLFPLLALAALVLVLTGCPNDEYIVELKPEGGGIERTLTFYRQDGTSEAGAPNYQWFDTNELADITALYPEHTATEKGKRHVVRGRFGNTMPRDVGGAGVYSNVTTSLGETGFYVERFRGDDDITGLAERRARAVDQVVDLFVGWSKAELRHEHGYDSLRHFLDIDLRRDLKNLGDYWWQASLLDRYQTNADEEFAVRTAQYLYERGYFSFSEVPGIINDAQKPEDTSLLLRVQRIVARKMGVPDTAPVPASLAFLASDNTITNSFDIYLAGTPQYRALLAQWKVDVKKDPKAQKPTPDKVMQDATDNVFALESGMPGKNPPDHLIVRLSLPAQPNYSNGRWDDALKQVVWDAALPETNALPMTCYATWMLPNEDFQKAHIGKVALTGDKLLQYCLWRSTLKPEWGNEWDAFLAQLTPGGAWWRTLDGFRFTGEPVTADTNIIQKLPSAYPRELLEGAIE